MINTYLSVLCPSHASVDHIIMGFELFRVLLVTYL
jgi:hypothetical protein